MGITKTDKREILSEKQRQDREINALQEKTSIIIKLEARMNKIKYFIVGFGFVLCIISLTYDLIAAAFLQQHSHGVGFQQFIGFILGLVILLWGSCL